MAFFNMFYGYTLYFGARFIMNQYDVTYDDSGAIIDVF